MVKVLIFYVFKNDQRGVFVLVPCIGLLYSKETFGLGDLKTADMPEQPRGSITARTWSMSLLFKMT